MNDTRQLRVLMIIHTQWSRNLGGPRVQLELGEELCKLGCEVSKFSYEDAFPEPMPRSSGKLGGLVTTLRGNRSFAKRAIARVQGNAERYDVIDAHQTDLPVPKAALGFSGLLVARSVGLIPEYAKFERWAERRWPQDNTLRQRVHRLMTMPGTRRRLHDVLPSFRHADLINVSNRDDLVTVRDGMGFGEKVVWFPFGLSDERRAAFDAAAWAPALRQSAKTIAFIGTWNTRKGCRDWPEIFARVRACEPDAKLLLLGTGIGEDQVRRGFPADAQSAISVIPSYDSEDLPRLLAGATVGAFPGYLEGFGFSVLEKIAAGLPTVAYDAPGPRDILGRMPQPAMLPPGDTAGFAATLASMLKLPAAAYITHAEQCREAAATFSWAEIAKATLSTYRQRLAHISER